MQRKQMLDLGGNRDEDQDISMVIKGTLQTAH